MKVSVITWDACFRERFHTIDSFANQNFDKDSYEFIWVDYYESNDDVRNKIEENKNFRLVTLNNHVDKEWHLGQCINAGVKLSTGDVLVVPDGDVLVEPDFIGNVFDAHDNQNSLLSYYRRYDEPDKPDVLFEGCDPSVISERTTLLNPLNYAGCFSVGRSLFLSLQGYEEHEIFSGPGMNAYEFYIRARNSGACIRWGSDRIYHPWHESTGRSSVEERDRQILKVLKEGYPWLDPYSGVEQSWVAHCREMNLDVMADISGVAKYLSCIPKINFSNVKTSKELAHERKVLAEEKLALGNEVESLKKEISGLQSKLSNIKSHELKMEVERRSQQELLDKNKGEIEQLKKRLQGLISQIEESKDREQRNMALNKEREVQLEKDHAEKVKELKSEINTLRRDLDDLMSMRFVRYYLKLVSLLKLSGT